MGQWQRYECRVTNVLTAVIVGMLVVLSIVLTAAVVFPDITGDRILEILVGWRRHRGSRDRLVQHGFTCLSIATVVKTPPFTCQGDIHRSYR